MHAIQEFLNSPVHWLVSMVVGDLTLLYFLCKCSYRFFRSVTKTGAA